MAQSTRTQLLQLSNEQVTAVLYETLQEIDDAAWLMLHSISAQSVEAMISNHCGVKGVEFLPKLQALHVNYVVRRGTFRHEQFVLPGFDQANLAVICDDVVRVAGNLVRVNPCEYRANPEYSVVHMLNADPTRNIPGFNLEWGEFKGGDPTCGAIERMQAEQRAREKFREIVHRYVS